MFITKKHIPRRAVLKAAGMTLGLPFLDAMVPAGTALAQTAAVPRLRTGFFYLPHGAIMSNTSHGPAADKWTPSGADGSFKLSPILASLEPYKKCVSSFGNLENAATAGSVHAFTPATWLSATRPDTGSARAHMATTLDQVIARVIGQDTPLPSLEVSSETIVQSAAGGGGSYSTLSFRDAESPLPMESNPRKVFLQLFGEGDTPQERASISRQTNSLLDLILDDTRSLQRDLGSNDKAVLDGYLESVREIERRTQKAGAKDLSAVTIPDAPVGELDSFPEQVKLMFDLIALAYQADLTRWLPTSWPRKVRTGLTTTSAFRIPSTPYRTMPTIWRESASWSKSRLGTSRSSRSFLPNWRERRMARERCSITRFSCTGRT